MNLYSYPQGKPEGLLKGFDGAVGDCTDKSGNVFVVNAYKREVLKYAHGGTKPLIALRIPTKDPVGCAIDPTTGDLAVGSQGSGTGGTVSVFKGARGKPAVYRDSKFYEFFFCGYDNNGNLFADGITSPGSGHFALAELRRGKMSLTDIAADQYILFPGGVQWDGKHLAIGNQLTDIYEFAIAGNKATAVGTTELGGDAMYVKQFWIQGQTLVAPNVYIKKRKLSNVLLYAYPAGGKPIKKISEGVGDAQGATVSAGTR